MNTLRSRTAVTLLLGLVWPSIVHPQVSLVSAALEGTVNDSSGARIPGATVNVREVSTHRTRETSTAADGSFHIAELPPGTYEVSASQAGFGAYRHAGVNLALGSTVRLDITMQAEGVTTLRSQNLILS